MIQLRRTWAWLSIALCSCTAAAGQPLQTRTFDARACATEGGHVRVALNDGNITRWEGALCVSAGCTNLTLEDMALDGAVKVTVKRAYQDGSEIAYTVKALRTEPKWRPTSMLSSDYAIDVARDIERVGWLFEQTQTALRNGDKSLTCRPD